MPSSISSPASSTDPALGVRALTGPAERPLVWDVDLHVAARETVVVLGPIHSGKSTLLRHLVGLERAASGALTVGHEQFDAVAPTNESLRELRKRIGAVFASSALLRQISALENVELPLLEHTTVTRSEVQDTARELLRESGLQDGDGLMPMELGRAEQRRVALARALALRPRILVLDEPTVGLDSHAAHEFDDTVEALQDRYGFGVLILTTEVRHAFGPAREIAVLVEGRIVARGDRETLQESEHPMVRRLLHRRGSE
jgi:phospholipid/cholesterol/gamma-HCH transport system ATP-binding protein